MIDPFRALITLSALSQLSELTKGLMQEDTRGEGVSEAVAKQTGAKDPVEQAKGLVDIPSKEENNINAFNSGKPKKSILSDGASDKQSLLGS